MEEKKSISFPTNHSGVVNNIKFNYNGMNFETTVFKKYPELAAIKQSLYDSGAVYAAMSGSGSAVFAMYRK